MAQEASARQLQRFYERHRRELFAYAMALTRSADAAEDAIQAAFSRLFERGELPRELRPYIFRCVRNAAVDEMRRAGREANCESIYELKAAPHSENNVRLKLEIERLLGELRANEREAIVLKIYGGLTFKEIAAMGDEPIDTVASRYRRGLKKMRERLEEKT